MDIAPRPVLSKWYVIAEPCRVSVPLIGVRDLGGAVWSYRHCIGPAFGEVLISPTLCEHLVLAMAFVVLSWAYKYWPFAGAIRDCV